MKNNEKIVYLCYFNPLEGLAEVVRIVAVAAQLAEMCILIP